MVPVALGYSQLAMGEGQSMVTNAAADSDQDALASVFKPADISTPAAFPHPVTQLELHETPVSWVILTGPFAYKIKKASD